MPDNYATLNPEEQKYFDTGGAEAQAETVKEQEKPAAVEKAPVAKKVAKPAKPEPALEEAQEADVQQEAPAEQPVKKTAEQEQIENLNAALREERAAAKRERDLTNQRLQQLQEAIVQRQQQPQAQQAQEIPDPEKDPMGALKVLLAQARENAQTRQVSAEEQERQKQTQRVMGEASRMEYEYLATLPDYDATARVSPTYNEATTYLVNMRRAELNAIGTYNPVQINQILSNETIGLAAQAMQAGRNPAQVVMDLAKARGFAPKPKEQPKQAQETEQEKLTRIAKGQEAGFSLGQAAGGKAPVNKGLDAKALLAMSDEAYAAWIDKAKKSDLRALFGD